MRDLVLKPFAFGSYRAAFRLLRCALHLLWGSATVALAFPFLGLAARRRLKQRWSRQLVAILGIRLSRGGVAPAGLIVANHISFIDIFVINAVAPTAFVSKNDVLNWPLIGWLCRHTETIFLQRGSRRAAQDTREVLTAHLAANGLAAVFPEGTTTVGDQVLPFHGALFQAAIDAGVPVSPAVIRYRGRHGAPSEAAAYVGETSLMECIRSIVNADGLAVDIRFLPALSTANTDRRHLAAHAHRQIAHQLHPAHPVAKG